MKKRIVVFVVGILLAVFIACGNPDAEEIDWINIRLGRFLPEPKSNLMEIIINDNERLSVYICNTSENDYLEYSRKCEESGYNIDVEIAGESFRGYNQDGYYLHIIYSDLDDEMQISLEEPVLLDILEWPQLAIEQDLPKPESERGSFIRNQPEGFSLKVGDVTIEEYEEYVDTCIEAGFDKNQQRSQKVYYADNEEGYHVDIRYEGFYTIWIQLDYEMDNMDKEDTDKIPLPCSDNSYWWTDYKEIEEDFRNAGFTNISTIPLGDLTEKNWLTSEGEYESISVAGNKEFKEGDLYSADVEIVIYYHSNSEENVEGETITVTKAEEDFIGLHYTEVERMLCDMGFENISFNSIYSENQKYVNGEVYTVYIRDGFFDLGSFQKGDTFSSEAEATIHYYEVKEVKPNLTVENCPELVTLLTVTNPADDYIEEFVREYKGRTIEFEGCTILVMNSAGYTTRFDVLIASGDYDGNRELVGPLFAFEDVNFFDMKVKGTEVVESEMNFSIVAEIKEFVEGPCIVLEPVSMTHRVVAVDSEYERAFVRRMSNYSLYYMFDEDSNTVVCFGTNDTYVEKGVYSGKFSSGVEIEWNHGQWTEKFIYGNGDYATMIDGNGFDWDYTPCDISEGQKILNELE